MKLQNCHGNLPYVSVSIWRRSFKMPWMKMSGQKRRFRKPELTKEHIKKDSNRYFVFFLFTLQSCWIITHILTAFSITFFTQFVKKPAIYSLVCLVRSLLLTTCSLIVQTSSTIWQFLWLNGQSTVKIDAWALAQTVYAFIFVKE